MHYIRVIGVHYIRLKRVRHIIYESRGCVISYTSQEDVLCPSRSHLKKMEKASVLTAENTSNWLRAGHNRSFIGPLHACGCGYGIS